MCEHLQTSRITAIYRQRCFNAAKQLNILFFYTKKRTEGMGETYNFWWLINIPFFIFYQAKIKLHIDFSHRA